MRQRYPAETFDYIVVWDGTRNSPSLLSDYSRPSSLASVAADSKIVLQQRHKGHRQRNGSAYKARQATYQAAKQYLAEVGL
jgi:hypothetical protein